MFGTYFEHGRGEWDFRVMKVEHDGLLPLHDVVVGDGDDRVGVDVLYRLSRLVRQHRRACLQAGDLPIHILRIEHADDTVDLLWHLYEKVEYI